MSDSKNPSLQNFFSDYSGKLPEHELELFLEAAFHQRFPDRVRLQRQQLYSGEALPDGDWIIQARIWAEKRLVAKVPLQHLTREQNFFGRYFEVGPEVLIPRPETEVLVNVVLEWLRAQQRGTVWGADIGAGSGIIPITILLESAPGLRMFATEVSPEALRRAQENASQLGVSGDSLIWIQPKDPSDVTTTLQGRIGGEAGKVDFLVSNPPYLRRDSIEVEESVERSEPAQALFAPDEDLLFYYRQIARAAPQLVASGGMVFLEIPHERSRQIRELFVQGFDDVRVIPDLAGRARVLEARVSQWTR